MYVSPSWLSYQIRIKIPLKPWFSKLPGTWKNWEQKKQTRKDTFVYFFSILGLHHFGGPYLEVTLLGTHISPPENLRFGRHETKRQERALYLAACADAWSNSLQRNRRLLILCSHFSEQLLGEQSANEAPVEQIWGNCFFLGGEERKVQNKVVPRPLQIFKGIGSLGTVSLDFVQVMFLYMVYHGRWAPFQDEFP